MTWIGELTAAEVGNMNYVEFISLLGETNRCPGGKQSIRKILHDTFIGPESRVLEIGSNTGFTSLEIARTVGATVIGIDPELSAVNYARELLSKDVAEVRNKCSFEIGSAYDIPFEDDTFDLVICGGATSFMEEKQTAISEYYRVLKPWKFLSVTNLCYFSEPPESVLDATSNIIGVKLQSWGPEQYLELFCNAQNFEVYCSESVYLGQQPKERITEYIAYFMNKPHLAKYDASVRAAIEERWLRTISIFNENHKYLGFLRAILRKAHIPEEPELFIPQALPDWIRQ